MNKEKEKVSLTVLIIAIIIVWIIVTVVIWFVFKDWNKSGTFGDTFGAINSLFSGLALAGIIYTIYLQKTELSLQRKELEYTRQELKRTADAQESSGKMMTEQLRINNIPLIDFHLETKMSEGFTIKIINQSNSPAFDLGIWILIVTDDKERPFKEFASVHLPKLSKESLDTLEKNKIDGKMWCVNDRGVYDYLSKGKAISIDLKRYLPISGKLIYSFIQYRDILGNNYYKVTNFMRLPERSSYFIYKNYPVTPEIIERFILSESSESKIFPLIPQLYNASVSADDLDYMILAFNEKRWDLVPFG